MSGLFVVFFLAVLHGLCLFAFCLLLFKSLILNQDKDDVSSNMAGFGYHKTHYFQLCDGEKTLNKRAFI